MKIMCQNIRVAHSYPKNAPVQGFEAEDWTGIMDLPLILFYPGQRRADFGKFMKWISERCIPPERSDVDLALQIIGLDHYDVLEIIKRTNGICAMDDFWIDFGSGLHIEYLAKKWGVPYKPFKS